MEVLFQDNHRDFLQKAGAFLDRAEVEHNLILSLSGDAEAKAGRGEKYLLRTAVLMDEGDVVCAALQTPPHNLILSKAAELNIDMLVEEIAKAGFTFPGVVGPSDVASIFFSKWGEVSGQGVWESMDQIIYSLSSVTPPLFKPEGKFRLAEKKEAPLLAEWVVAFTAEAVLKTEKLSPEKARAKVDAHIQNGQMAVWDVGGKPVSVCSARYAKNISRVGGVYTPPDMRGKGYASALVAAFSQYQLDQGKKTCCLYADARNPVSNSIYRKIGYEFVSRSSHYVFKAAA